MTLDEQVAAALRECNRWTDDAWWEHKVNDPRWGIGLRGDCQQKFDAALARYGEACRQEDRDRLSGDGGGEDVSQPDEDDEYHPGWCPWCGQPVGVCDGDCDPEDEDDDE